jgi:hypothetical protein
MLKSALMIALLFGTAKLAHAQYGYGGLPGAPGSTSNNDKTQQSRE